MHPLSVEYDRLFKNESPEFSIDLNRLLIETHYIETLYIVFFNYPWIKISSCSDKNCYIELAYDLEG